MMLLKLAFFPAIHAVLTATDVNHVTLGILGSGSVNGEDLIQAIKCSPRLWSGKTRLETVILTYDKMNRSSLAQTAERITDLDIIVGFLPYVVIVQLQHILGKDQRSVLIKPQLSEITWFIRMTKPDPWCSFTEELVQRHCSDQRIVMQYLADVTATIGWTTVSIFFDSTYADEASMLAEELSMEGIKIYQYQINSTQSSLPFLEQSYRSISVGWRRYILLASEQTVNQVFDELNSFDDPGLAPTAMKLFSLWIVWSRSMTLDSIEGIVVNISNVAVLERPGCYPQNNGREVKLSHTDFCTTASQSEIFYPGNSTSNPVCNLMEDIMESIESENNMASVFKLSTAMWQNDGRRFHTVLWDENKRPLISNEDVFPNTKYGMNNMNITVTTLEWELFVYSNELPDGTIEYSGLCIDILIEASRRLNFSFTIKRPEDREWGRQVNGTWTGLIGDIVYKRADLQVACLSIQEERVEVMDFTTQFYIDYYNIILRMPDKEDSRWMILLRPLNWQVLLTIACVFPIVTLCVWVCERFSPYYNTFPGRSGYRGLHNVGECVVYMYGSLFSRSGNYLPRAVSARTILSFWWLFIVVIFATYCGHLMAFLAVTLDKKPFTTIAGMLQQDQYKWGTQKGTYIFDLFQSSNDPEYRQVGKGMMEYAEIEPDATDIFLEGHARLLEEGSYVYIADSVIIETMVNSNCDYVKGDEEFLMLYYSLGLPKDSAYTQMFTELVVSFHEAGLIDMWTKKWTTKAIACQSRLQTKARKIMMIDIQSSFYVLIGGVVISALLCTAEVTYKKLYSVPRIAQNE